MQSTITFIVNVIDSRKASETKQSLQLFNYSVKISALNTADYRIVKCFSKIEAFIIMAYHLNLIARKYKMTISSTKTFSVEMCGNHIQRVEIVINDNFIEQVTDFKYLGYRISEYRSDFEDNLQTYSNMNGVYGDILENN